MSLKDYFEKTKGVGILSTADEKGNVDAAVYATPHVLEEGSVAFIMRQRLSHYNVTQKPQGMLSFYGKLSGI